MPAISLSVAIMIGFREIDLVSLIGIFASPCAVSSYTMARQMDSDYELSAGTVVLQLCFRVLLYSAGFIFKRVKFLLMYKLHKYHIQSLYNIYKWLILNEIKNMLDLKYYVL